MFSICKQSHPATGVEHALSCHFFNRSEKSLIVASTNVIKVFRLIPDVDVKNRNEHYTESRPPKMKLECLTQYTLNGNIMSMQCVNLANSSRDALLLSFRDAKLSVVEYDPDNHDLKTLSLHYFEDEEMKDGWTHHHQIPMVRTDPENRCSVMTVYGTKIVVLPFRKENNLDETDLLDVKPLSNPSGSNKSPILSSYMIVLKDLDEKIDNIVDIQFLFGYYEPTLLILYEPVQTFSGRVAVRSDTCCMVAISLNIAQRVHPIIWSVANLPFDCVRAVPVRRPLGGTLIISVNALIYLNQSVPPYGVALNSIAETCTTFPLKPQENLKISLDCSQVTFISDDQLVISLKGGELYVLTMFADSMRSVRSFHFEKAAASVLTTCICVCEDNYMFLGSRLGNSLLLKFTEKENYQVITIDEKNLEESDNSIRGGKRAKLDSISELMPSDVLDIRDPEELEVYGNEKQTSVQITSYIFEVCDSLLNIGPCGEITMGETAFLSEEYTNNIEHDIELVTTSGYGKNGALCVLQRSIRPQVVTTFELPGSINMWTVVGSHDETMHAFLILTQEDSTMVLQTGQEINEIENSGFCTSAPTVYACNLGKNKYIAQVTTSGVRLLSGAKQLQHIPLDFGSPIVHASSSDPYLAIMSSDGQVVILSLRESRGSTKLVVSKSSIVNNPPISTLCLYRDLSGLFSSVILEDIPEQHSDMIIPDEHLTKPNIENEDDLLYGDESAFQMPTITSLPSANLYKRKSFWWKKHLTENKPTYWLCVLRENLNLEIYSIPEFKLSYLIQNIAHGSKVLIDSLESVPSWMNVSNITGSGDGNKANQVKEIQMVALGNHGSRPLLLIRLENELLIYEVFRFSRGNLKIRFKKYHHGIIYSQDIEGRIDTENVDFYQLQERVCKLRYFSNIAGYNGIFVCGARPYWLFLTYRGELRTHPMWIDGEVTCFASFNNINCPQGFLYFNKKGELRICALAQHVSYDAPWPVRKVPLRHSALHVAYHIESRTYAVASAIAEPSTKYYRFNGEDKELTEEDRGDRFPYPLQQQFQIYLFSPVSWQQIPNTRIELDEWEHVTCLKNVSLAYEGTRSGLKGYIAVGTNYNYGEDITSRGRILIYDIIEVVPEPGQPLTKNRFKTIYAKDQKGPVTAISQVLGFLVSAVGQKIYIWQLKDNDLVGVAFIDTQIYIHQILSIKSLILVADVYKSISLLRFQDEYRTLSLVSRDYRQCEVFTLEYLIDNSNLSFLISDSERNIVLYMYQPEARESCGGQRLLRKADFHLGQLINSMFRIRCKSTTLNEQKHFIGADRKHVTMFATLDGGLGYILPLNEKTYRRLLMLQNVLVLQGKHTAGLNPKSFRTYKSRRKLLANPSRSIIDGDLVWQFLYLSSSEKLEISKKIGTKIEEILDDIAEIDELTSHF